MSKNKGDNGDDDARYVVNVQGTRIPANKISVIEELDEHNYDTNKDEYFILINKAEGNLSVYSNIKIKCLSYSHRNKVLENMESVLSKLNYKFITI